MPIKKFFDRAINFVKARYAPRGARLSFAGSGEDLIISDVLKKRGIKKVFYLDIGAYHPVFGSNTYLFYKNGGRGVLVEPNTGTRGKFEAKRPRDIFVNAGVGATNGEADFYSFKRDTRNTFSKEEALAWEKQSGEKAKVEKRPIFSLDTLIEKFCAENPHFISLDTEGLEIEILSAYSFKHRPLAFCLEAVASSGIRKREIDVLLEGHGYELCGQTEVNAIFVRKS